MRFQQLNLIPKPSLAHGGGLRVGKRKIQRPFDRKRPLHLVIKSTKAKGAWSFLNRRNKGLIHALALDLSARYGVKLYRYENVGNHIHLLAQFPSRRELKAFLRVFCQRVMFQVTGACKGNPQGKFFDAIAFSRVVSWGKEFLAMKTYLWKNAMEGLGFDAEMVGAAKRSAKLVPL